MKLGEILIAAGALTTEGLREALDWQADHGGRLGTNLLELGLVDEAALGRALSHQLGVEVITGPLQLDPQLAELLPQRTVVRQEMMPWRMEKHRLKLVGTEPADVGLLDALTQQTGKPCVAVVAPEFRIVQALRANYGAVRELRPLDEGKVPEKALAERRLRRKKQEGQVVEEAPILLDEGAFAAIGAEITATHRVKAGEAAGDAAASELAAELREAGAIAGPAAAARFTPGPGRTAPSPSGRPPPPSQHGLPAARPVPPSAHALPAARPVPPSWARPPPPSAGRPPPEAGRPPPEAGRPPPPTSSPSLAAAPPSHPAARVLPPIARPPPPSVRPAVPAVRAAPSLPAAEVVAIELEDEAIELPRLEPDEPPLVDLEEPPLVDLEEPPLVEPDEPPLVEPDELPVVEPDEPPVVEPDELPLVEAETLPEQVPPSLWPVGQALPAGYVFAQPEQLPPGFALPPGYLPVLLSATARPPLAAAPPVHATPPASPRVPPPGPVSSATRATSPGVPRRQASAEALARLKAQLGLSDGGPGPDDQGKP